MLRKQRKVPPRSRLSLFIPVAYTWGTRNGNTGSGRGLVMTGRRSIGPPGGGEPHSFRTMCWGTPVTLCICARLVARPLMDIFRRTTLLKLLPSLLQIFNVRGCVPAPHQNSRLASELHTSLVIFSPPWWPSVPGTHRSGVAKPQITPYIPQWL